jgi:hypothetical protein
MFYLTTRGCYAIKSTKYFLYDLLRNLLLRTSLDERNPCDSLCGHQRSTYLIFSVGAVNDQVQTIAS